MPVTGPDFISLQARDLDASQAFYERYLGLVRSQAGPPHAVVFETTPIAFALRDVVPGTDLGVRRPARHRRRDLAPRHRRPGDSRRSRRRRPPIVSAPIDGPFGRTFTFADPDGYQITLHDRR